MLEKEANSVNDNNISQCPECYGNGKSVYMIDLDLDLTIQVRFGKVLTTDTCRLCDGVKTVDKETAFEYVLRNK